MLRKPVPSPALVVACLSLLVSLGGSAYAAGVVPLAKRALVAEDARKLQGRSVAQISARSAAIPGPASTVSGLVSLKVGRWSLAPNEGREFTVACAAGEKAVSGGYDDPVGFGHVWDSRPAPTGSAWQTYVSVSASAVGDQSGSLYAVCLK